MTTAEQPKAPRGFLGMLALPLTPLIQWLGKRNWRRDRREYQMEAEPSSCYLTGAALGGHPVRMRRGLPGGLIVAVAGAVTLVSTGLVSAGAGGSGSISGTVTEEGSGLPADVCVTVYYPWGHQAGSARTGASGAYQVDLPVAGQYKVKFEDCVASAFSSVGPVGRFHFPEWYDDAPDRGTADNVVVEAGRVTAGIDAALTVGGSINGTVTEEDTGAPLGDISAFVRDDQFLPVAQGRTDASGRYSAGPLRSGTYSVTFSGSEHLGEWYDNREDGDSADAVAVTIGQRTEHIDAALTRGGSISGSVTAEDSGEPLTSICVRLETVDGRRYLRARTDGLGNYTLAPVMAGDYRVEYHDCSAVFCLPPHLRFLPEWYDDRPDSKSADIVSVGRGEEKPGVDAALARESTKTPQEGPTPTPTPQLTWSISVDPAEPSVGDEVEVTAYASGNGGIPEYTLIVSATEGDPVLRVDSSPTSFTSFLGSPVWWRLTALRAGDAVLGVQVFYEKFFCHCPNEGPRDDCYHGFFFDGASSPQVAIHVVAGPTAVATPTTIGTALATPTPHEPPGDSNCDRRTDSIDAALVLQYGAGLVPSLACHGNADVSGDGLINSIDAALILQFTAGLIPSLSP